MARLFFSYCNADEGLRDRLEKASRCSSARGWSTGVTAVSSPGTSSMTPSRTSWSEPTSSCCGRPGLLASRYCWRWRCSGPWSAVPKESPRHPGDPTALRIGAGAVFEAAGDAERRPGGGEMARSGRSVSEHLQPFARRGGEGFSRPDRYMRAGHRRTSTYSLGPRSGNLSASKRFADPDRDRFLDEAFHFIHLFFENRFGRSSSAIARSPPPSGSSTQITSRQLFTRMEGRVHCRISLEQSHRSSGEIQYSNRSRCP